MNLLTIDEIAKKLEKWAERVEPKLPEHIGHISFYGSLKKALDNLPDLAFTWLQSRMPEQLELIRKDFDGLYEKARDVDHYRSEGSDSNIAVCMARADARKLAQKLRLIEKMTQEDLRPKKPAETGPDTTPAKRRGIWTLVKAGVIGALIIILKRVLDWFIGYLLP